MQWPEGTVYSGDGNDLQPQKNQIQFELQIHRGYKYQIIINLQPTPDIYRPDKHFSNGEQKKNIYAAIRSNNFVWIRLCRKSKNSFRRTTLSTTFVQHFNT